MQEVNEVDVDIETHEIEPINAHSPKAIKMAVYVSNEYNNPRGFYFISTPEGWKLGFVDDSLCGA
ncbi:MAG: hypothetical protein PHI32_08240 [Dysgonamonadaceae bacterium]|nr:hypothetical protein [Dysgonamonadaceae bacterium]MDD4728500.1 hypothetical protein [Dysgonamonadaceae bacterium]